MEYNRRDFITSASTVGVGGLLFPTWALGQALPSPDELDTMADFQDRLKEWFYLFNDDPEQQGNLRLVEVADRGSSAQLQQFSLTLKSRRGALPLPSGFYQVAGEPFSLSIKHTHENRSQQYYTADFALLMQQ